MKRGLMIVFICISLILVLSFSFVSAFSLGDLGDFFKKLFEIEKPQYSPSSEAEASPTIMQEESPTPVATIIPTRSPTQTPPTQTSESSGLIAYYKFDRNVEDSSGNSNHGTLKGGATFVDNGKIRQAIQLDGIDDYVDLGLKPIINQSKEFTISAWIKTASPNAKVIYSEQSYPYTSVSLWVRISETIVNFSIHNPATNRWNILNGNAFVSDNNWHHVAATFSTTDGMKIYINGTLDSSNSLSTDLNNAKMPVIGAAMAGINQTTQQPKLIHYFNGAIDELSIYNKALTQAEIEKLYSEIPTTTNCNNSSLLGDVNNDEKINATDATIVSDIITGKIPMPSNICCIDLVGGGKTGFGDGKINLFDVNEIIDIYSKGNPNNITGACSCNNDGICNTRETNKNCPNDCRILTIHNCNNNSLLGDINNDKRIDKTDAKIVSDISIEKIEKPSNVCCIDLNQDSKVDIYDVNEIVNIYAKGNPNNITGACSCNNNGICNTRETNENCPNDCRISLINATLTISTLKDTYFIGEQINLTDPPEENEENNIEIIDKLTGGIVEPPSTNFHTDRDDRKELDYSYSTIESDGIYRLITGEELQKRKSYGYIVQYKDEPVIVRKTKLENRAQKNQEFIENHPIISTITLQKFFALTPEKVPEKVRAYSEDIDKKNIGIKDKIFSEIGKGKTELKSLGEYKEVFNGIALNISSQEAEQIKKLKELKQVYPNLEVNVTLMDSVPLINADDVWNLGYTGDGVSIAIIDTGVDYTHPDLGGCFGGGCKVIDGYDFVNNDSDPIDDHGHGTHVAGIAAGNGALKGVAPDAQILAYKVLDTYGGGSFSNVISAIERAADPNQDGNFSDHVDVISMSLGASCGAYSEYCGPDDPVSLTVDNAVNAGIVAVIAAGNDGPNEQTIGSPGTARKAITVGATDKNDVITGFSSRGPVIWQDAEGNEKAIVKPDIVAPGVSICAAQHDEWLNDRRCLDNKHIAISGTSMATPHVAGAVALLKQKNPDWTPDEIKSALKSTAVDIGENVITQGQGRIDVLEAVKLISPPEMPWDFYVYSDNVINNIYDKTTIKGIFLEDYDSLVVEWRKEEETSWRSDGISIIGRNMVVAEFEPEGIIIDTEDYEFRARIIKAGVEKTSIAGIYFDKDLRKGWPKKISDFGVEFPSFVVEDIDSDGMQNVLVGDYSGKLYVFDERGNYLEGWPLQFDSAIISDIITIDINNDGYLEIFFATWDQKLHGYDHSGNILEGWPKITDISMGGYHSLIAEDINDDGKYELIFLPTSNNLDPNDIYIYNTHGEIISSWPVSDAWTKIFDWESGPAIGDVNNDGKDEIIIPMIDGDDSNYYVYVFDYEGNTLKKLKLDGVTVGVSRGPDWMSIHKNTDYSRPVIGDIDNDGDREVIISRTNYFDDLVKIFAWSYENGDYVNIISREIENTKRNGLLSLGDLNKDGDLEIIAGFDNIYGHSWVGVFEYDGNILWESSTTIPYTTFRNQPLVGDIDGDDEIEILIVGLYGGNYPNFENMYIYIYDSDGVSRLHAQIPSGSFISRKIISSSTITDIDNNGDLELIFVSPSLGLVGALNLYTPFNPSTMDWPMFQHDPQHTGCYDCEKKPHPSRPKSMINNTGTTNIQGYLLMKVQKKVELEWQDVEVVVDDKSINNLRTISAGNYLALDTIWANAGSYITTEVGTFRVYAALVDLNGNVIETSDGKLEDSWGFEVA